MNQSSLVQSTDKSAYEMNPVLQAVMDSLDVQLEQELTRYRKYRKRNIQQSPQIKSNKQIYKTPDLISITLEDQQIASLPSLETELPQENNQPNGSVKERSPEIIEPPTPAELNMAKTGDRESTSTDSLNQVDDNNISHKLGENNSTAAPDNYLESSEKLLESLDDLKSRRREQPNYLASLFTPLGIASMFLFLVSCTTLGYVLMNPSGLSNLGLDLLFKGNSTVGQEDEDNNQNQKEQPLPKSPNLASQEFVDLDLNSLSNVNPQPSQFPSPTATTKPVVPAPISGGTNTSSFPTYKPSAELDNLSSTLLPNYAQSANNQPTTNTPSTTPAPSSIPTSETTNNSEITSPIQSDDGWYYVVVDYVNEESLYQAQQVISDAYIRETDDGTKIQMGALWEPERAKTFLKELRAEGLNPKYYKFKPESY
ncbi:MAG: hypothetical protein QNJ68_08490 [Microcoleaceae cyanobacterium MO_207.B10]|nr:hypothetical protein [Microcoleaceae cyanobacterium MO_207.B10]